jgi:hypothetical protein
MRVIRELKREPRQVPRPRLRLGVHAAMIPAMLGVQISPDAATGPSRVCRRPISEGTIAARVGSV